MKLLLACGFGFTSGQWVIVYAMLAMVAAVPCLAVMNVVLAFAGATKRSPLHFVLIVLYAGVALALFAPRDKFSIGPKLGTAAVAANLVVGQFAYLVFVNRRERRARRLEPLRQGFAHNMVSEREPGKVVRAAQ